MRNPDLGIVLTAAILAAACQEPTADLTQPTPAFSYSATGSCPAHADFVATDMSSLLTAVSAARPNDTVAVSGTIDVSGTQVIITTDDLTITCATPGSGLRTEAGSGIDWLLMVFARRVSVERLTLDATNVGDGAYLAYFNPDVGAFAGDARFANNVVTCGPGRCAFVGADNFAQMHGALVAGNSFIAAGGQNAIQAQGIDGARIERNTVTAAGPSTDGIASNGTIDLSVTDNTITGPFATSLDLFDGVFSSSVARNRVGGGGDPIVLVGGDGVQFVDNEVQCGGTCLFTDGAARSVIANNRFESAGSGTGVHLQTGTDSSRIEGNTIIATAPSSTPFLGGIRVRDGRGVVIAHNVVSGPWANSLALTDLPDARVEDNRLQGAQAFGAAFTTGASFLTTSITGNVVRNNQIIGAGSGGMLVQSACGNTFLGNELGASGLMGLVFASNTGANTYVGNRAIVIDNGNFDCNGDGDVDPNILMGPGVGRSGVNLGQLLRRDAGATSGKLH